MGKYSIDFGGSRGRRCTRGIASSCRCHTLASGGKCVEIPYVAALVRVDLIEL